MSKSKKWALFFTALSFIFTFVADEFTERENQAETDRMIEERVEERVSARMKALEAPRDEVRS